VALLTTFWGDTNIISRAIVGPATINRQGKVERVEYLDQIPSFFPVPRKKTAYILDLRDEHFDYVDADGVPLRADRFDFEQGIHLIRSKGGIRTLFSRTPTLMNATLFIFHALGIRPSVRWKLLELQFKARQKKTKSKQVSSCVVFIYHYFLAYSSHS
jgi:hypothetical protein